MRRLSVLVLLLGACVGKGKSSSVSGGLTTGAITAPIHAEPSQALLEMPVPGVDTTRVNGIELRGFMAGSIDDKAIPNAYGFSVRQLGNGVQSSIQTGYMLALPVGSTMIFGRIMMDLLSWTRLDEDHTVLSGLSPTLDIGFAPFGHGVCVSASSTWDVRFNNPDRMIVGGYVGLCGSALKR